MTAGPVPPSPGSQGRSDLSPQAGRGEESPGRPNAAPALTLRRTL